MRAAVFEGLRAIDGLINRGRKLPHRLTELRTQQLKAHRLSRRRRIAGTVTMDQLIVDCGTAADVQPGDEVVLIGRQGGEEVTAEEWAERLGTIVYEVLCGIGSRVPRCAV